MRWIVFALVLTLLFSTHTYGVQSAEAINPIKGYVSSGGTGGAVVEVEIGENGTATTTSPETSPAPEEDPEPEEKDDEDFETGQETATKAGETIKETVSKTVKETAKDVNDEIEEKVEEVAEEVCRSTACLMKKRHAEEIRAWEESQGINNEDKVESVNGTTTDQKKCTSTACLMKQKQLQEQIDAGIDVGDCQDTACLLKRIIDGDADKEKERPVFHQKIITLSLSNGCLQAHKNNVTSICPTYKDLMQFDNTDQGISGKFVTEDNGFYHRADTKYEKHCNFYQPQLFPVVIVVDPDSCWHKERGAYTITINAISPENFKFKITDSYDVDRLRDIQKQDTRILNEEAEWKAEIDKYEDLIEDREDQKEIIEERLEDFDKETRELYEEVGQNADLKAKRDDERKIISDQLTSRSWERQERAWNTELREAQLEYDLIIAEKKELRSEQTSIKGNSSEAIVNGTLIFGVGRSFEECRHASVGSNITLIGDTINDMIQNCEGDLKNKETLVLDQTPVLNLLEFTEYRYKAWITKMTAECLGLCKEY